MLIGLVSSYCVVKQPTHNTLVDKNTQIQSNINYEHLYILIELINSLHFGVKLNACARGLTCVSHAANRWTVSGRSGSIFPSSVASCRRHADAAERRVVLRLGREMKLWVGFLLQRRLLLRERPVAAGGTPSGRCGTQARQLWLKTKVFYFNLKFPCAIRFLISYGTSSATVTLVISVCSRMLVFHGAHK